MPPRGRSRTREIALYFGAFLLLAGSLFYFAAHRFYHAVTGVAGPAIVLAVPFAGLNLAARHLYRTERRAVAVAFMLAGVVLLPLFLLICFHEMHLLASPAGAPGQLFTDGSISNRQLQVTVLLAWAWSLGLAVRTRTIALSTVFTLLALLFSLAVLADAGLRGWIEQGRADLLALHLLPLVGLYLGLGIASERTGRPWLAQPLYVGATVLTVAVLDLLALDGKTFEHLGITLRALQPPAVSDPTLIDTLGALSLNGIVFYLLAAAMEKANRDPTRGAAGLLLLIAPFSALEPLAWLVETGDYSLRFDWWYLGLAVLAAVASHHRQRKNLYYAGIINTGFALYLIADHRDWFDRPSWAVALVIAGLAAMVAGFGLDARERAR